MNEALTVQDEILADDRLKQTKNHFEDMPEQEIDDTARATAAKATHKQTKWALKIMRGKVSFKK